MLNNLIIDLSSVEKYCLYGALIFFAAFLICLMINKTAAKQDPYTSVNTIHFRIMLIYLTTIFVIAFIQNSINLKFLVGIMVGLFIYLSLHYVFLFSLIGLCRKSISISILISARKISKDNGDITVAALTKEMQLKGLDTAGLRKTRLEQMTHLGFATTEGNEYVVSRFGRTINRTTKLIIDGYGLKRL